MTNQLSSIKQGPAGAGEAAGSGPGGAGRDRAGRPVPPAPTRWAAVGWAWLPEGGRGAEPCGAQRGHTHIPCTVGRGGGRERGIVSERDTPPPPSPETGTASTGPRGEGYASSAPHCAPTSTSAPGQLLVPRGLASLSQRAMEKGLLRQFNQERGESSSAAHSCFVSFSKGRKKCSRQERLPLPELTAPSCAVPCRALPLQRNAGPPALALATGILQALKPSSHTGKNSSHLFSGRNQSNKFFSKGSHHAFSFIH